MLRGKLWATHAIRTDHIWLASMRKPRHSKGAPAGCTGSCPLAGAAPREPRPTMRNHSPLLAAAAHMRWLKERALLGYTPAAVAAHRHGKSCLVRHLFPAQSQREITKHLRQSAASARQVTQRKRSTQHAHMHSAGRTQPARLCRTAMLAPAPRQASGRRLSKSASVKVLLHEASLIAGSDQNNAWGL